MGCCGRNVLKDDRGPSTTHNTLLVVLEGSGWFGVVDEETGVKGLAFHSWLLPAPPPSAPSPEAPPIQTVALPLSTQPAQTLPPPPPPPPPSSVRYTKTSAPLTLWNVRGAVDDKVAALLALHDTDTLALVETWAKPNIAGFAGPTKEREDRQGGGVALLTRRQHKPITLPDVSPLEAVAALIEYA